MKNGNGNDAIIRGMLTALLKGNVWNNIKRLGIIGGFVAGGVLWWDSVEDLKREVAEIRSTQEILLYYAVFEHGDMPQGPLTPSQRAVMKRLLGEK